MKMVTSSAARHCIRASLLLPVFTVQLISSAIAQNGIDPRIELRRQLSQCWSSPAVTDGAKLQTVTVRFRLKRTGELDGAPEVIRGGGIGEDATVLAASAIRAVSKCAPFNLPADKYDTWAEVVVNFDPTDMF